MKAAFSWLKPNGKRLEKAEKFFWNPHPFSAMVGGIRNAKTTAAVRRTIFLSLAFPGNKALEARYENTALEISTLAVFKEEIKRLNDGKWGPGPIIKKVNETDNFLELVNDSLIYWRHLDKPEDAQGTEWGIVHVDELHEVKEETFNQLKSRMTYWNPRRIAEFLANEKYMKWQKQFLGMNVTPQNYFYVTQNPSPNWTKKRIKENPQNEFYVIESSTMDNIENLPPEWWDSVKNMPDEWKKRFIEGSWEIAGGQVYKEFSTSIHVIDEIPLNPQWRRQLGQDFGLRHPTVVLWTATDEYGNVFVYNEHYEAGKLPEYHATVIKAKSDQYVPTYEFEGKTFIETVADPSGKNRSIASAEKLFDEYLLHGIACKAANHDFPLGYTRVSQYLHVDPDHIHPVTGMRGSPRLFIFRNCQNTINEFISYEWKTLPDNVNRAESEEPKKVKDDAMDTLRYIMVERPEPSTIAKKQEPATHYQRAAAAAFEPNEEEEAESLFN